MARKPDCTGETAHGTRTALGRMHLIALMILAGMTLSAGPRAANHPALNDCPAYRAHMLKARDLLAKADRTSALEELKHARAALESCAQNQESTGPAALARAGGADLLLASGCDSSALTL